MKERISKILSSCLVSSRRKSELIILSGRVKANGFVVQDLTEKFDIESDLIEVDNVPISTPPTKTYIAFHKPVGFECSKIKTKRSIYNLLPESKKNLFYIGRLDVDSSGLLLMSNDGNFCNKISHPSSGVKKHYIVTVKNRIKDMHIKRMKKGAFIDRSMSVPEMVKKESENIVRIIVKDGKKHEVRIIVALSGLELISLKRVQIGDIHIGSLKPGKWREISPKITIKKESN